MWRRKVPAYQLAIALVVGSAVAVVYTSFFETHAQPVPAKKECELRVERMLGYNGIKPLLFTEHECESPLYEPIRQRVEALIKAEKEAGTIGDAAFYLRDFRHSEWTAFNGNMPFEPGSLMKIPLLMTYLRMAERDAALMSRRYVLPRNVDPPKFTWFPPERTIEAGKPYSVPQLLDAAITHSDNMAVYVLLMHVDQQQFHRTYTDLGLADFGKGDTSYPISAKAVSIFMQAIYNSTYLSLDDSELAVSMLSGSKFDQGIKAGLPSGVRVAHKFGEAFDGRYPQLHETALVYVGSDAYLLTVMTKGPEPAKLAGVIAGISRIVYEEMARNRGVPVHSAS